MKYQNSQPNNKKGSLLTSLAFLIISIIFIYVGIFQSKNDKKMNLIDQDGDGFYTVLYNDKKADCNDIDKSIYPDAKEIQGDGIDQNCDGKDEPLSFDSSIFEQKFREYDEYKMLSKIEIYKHFTTPSEINTKTIVENSRRIKAEGKFEDVYLFIECGIKEGLSSLGLYDSFYFYIDSGDDGGQVLRSKSFPTNKEGAKNTTLLYKNKIPITYLPYKDRDPLRSINLLEKINSENGGYDRKHYLGAFVSTLQDGKIMEMSIGYKCESENKCKIELIN